MLSGYGTDAEQLHGVHERPAASGSDIAYNKLFVQYTIVVEPAVYNPVANITKNLTLMTCPRNTNCHTYTHMPAD